MAGWGGGGGDTLVEEDAEEAAAREWVGGPDVEAGGCEGDVEACSWGDASDRGSSGYM